jgi:hypothetical protein
MSPFSSKSQQRYMFSQIPSIAKRWSREYPNQGKLPEKSAVMDALKKRKKKV